MWMNEWINQRLTEHWQENRQVSQISNLKWQLKSSEECFNWKFYSAILRIMSMQNLGTRKERNPKLKDGKGMTVILENWLILSAF